MSGGYCRNILRAVFFYRASGGQLPVYARSGLLVAGLLFLIADMVNVAYNKTTGGNTLISLSRLFVSWFFIVFALLFAVVIILNYFRIQYPEFKRHLKRLLLIFILIIPAELASNYGRVFFQQHQIPRYFFSSSVFYLLWSLVNIRFLIQRLMDAGHPETAGGRDLFYQIHSISEREREIVELVVQGLSNQEIAAQLHIGLATVKTHLHRIFFKTGAKSRMELLHKLNSPGNAPPGKQIR